MSDDLYTPDAGEEEQEETYDDSSLPTTFSNASSVEVPSASAPLRLGFCPFCQVPFAALSRVESESWHVSSCLSSPSKAAKKCEAGRLCDSTIPSHYKKFTHCALAEWRDAGVAASDKTSTNSHLSAKQAASHFSSCVSKGVQAKSATPDPKARNSLKMEAKETDPRDGCRLESFFISGGTYHSQSSPEHRPTPTTKRLDYEMEEYECSLGMEAHVEDREAKGGEHSGAVVRDSQKDGFEYEDSRSEWCKVEADVELEQDEEGEELSCSETQAMRTFIDEQLAEDGFEEAETVAREFKTDPQLIGPSGCEEELDRVEDDEWSNDVHDKCNDTFALLMRNAKKQSSAKGSSGGKGKAKGKKLASSSTPASVSYREKTKENIGDQQSSDGNNNKSVASSNHVISKEASEWLKKKTAVFSKIPAPSSASSSRDNDKNTTRNPSKSKPLGRQNDARESESHTGDDVDGTIKTNEGKRGGNKRNDPRPCPFYKWIPNTAFTVDAFSFGQIENCQFYFLSHFHADHYKGLTKKFQGGQIVCSKVTANLVKSKLGISPSMILSASVDETLQLESARITLIEANHCPGAVLFLFRLSNGKAFLHTGDFRADEEMLRHPTLQQYLAKDCRKRLDGLFLDTTYLDPRYSFPPQRDVIEFAVKLAVDFVQCRPKTLIICGSYTIGKERIFKAIAQELRVKVFVRDDKLRILNCLEDYVLTRLLTRNALDAHLHVLPMHLLNKRSLLDYLRPLKSRFDNVLALKPTGWTYQEQGSSTLQPRSSSPLAVLSRIEPQFSSDGITVYGIPYSEHSSFDELKRFVQATRPTKIIPTVNIGNAEKRDSMQRYFHQWLNE